MTSDLQDFEAALSAVERLHGERLIESGDVEALQFHFRLMELLTDIAESIVLRSLQS